MFYKKVFQKKNDNGNNKGFSLMELLIAITILVGMIAAIIGNLSGRRNKAQINQAKIIISRLEDAINTFYLDCSYYPSSAEGLEALVIAPEKCESWGPEPYLKKGRIPKDPWKNEFIYQYDENSGTFEIISTGRDGKAGGEGLAADISSKDI